MKKIRFLGIAIFLGFIMVLEPIALASGQGSSDARYFPETGHTVRGDFLTFYESSPDVAMLLGYPITEAIDTNGVVTQYFQRAVLQQGPQDAQPRPQNIGQLLWEKLQAQNQRRPIASGISISNCDDSLAYPVCGEFLTFYRRYKGFLGAPVGPAVMENGEMVQYFVTMRLVWRNGRVVPSEAGEYYFELFEPNKLLRLPTTPGNALPRSNAIIRVRAKVAVKTSIVSPNDEQVLYVRAVDQIGQPLSQAVVSVEIIQLTERGNVSVNLPVTQQTFYTDNEGGVAIAFAVPDSIGPFAVRVDVSYQGKQTTVQTTFLVWY